jgi:hypothetical protein
VGDNIKIDLREIRWGSVVKIDLTQNKDKWRALVNTIMNLWIAQHAWKLLNSCTTGGSSTRA